MLLRGSLTVRILPPKNSATLPCDTQPSRDRRPITVGGCGLFHDERYDLVKIFSLDSFAGQDAFHGRPDTCLHIVAMSLRPSRP